MYDDVFEDYGEALEYMTLEKCYERDNKLYKKSKELKEYEVAKNPQRDDFGLYKYVDQYFGELSAELDDISDADADNMIETIEKLYEVMKGRKWNESERKSGFYTGKYFK
mgnify:CR=1 FL=1